MSEQSPRFFTDMQPHRAPRGEPEEHEPAFDLTKAEDELQEALTRRALSWLKMLSEGQPDPVTHEVKEYPFDVQITAFKTISDWFTKSRRTKSDREGSDTIPGIEALKQAMRGEFESSFNEMARKKGVLMNPPKKPGRPSKADLDARERLALARETIPEVAKRAPAPRGADDNRLQLMLRAGQRAAAREELDDENLEDEEE